LEMSFLGVVIDCQAENWTCESLSADRSSGHLSSCFQSLIAGLVAFCNGHMLSSVSNQVLLVAGGSGINGTQRKLFNSYEEIEERQGDYVNGEASSVSGALKVLELRLKRALNASLDKEMRENAIDVSVEAGSSNGHLNCHQGYVYSSAISLCLCAFRHFKNGSDNKDVSPGQIIIVNLTRDLSEEQSQLMSLWFSARQLGAVVNVISLAFHGQQAVPVLQQCDITGGVHLLLENPALLGHILTKYFLISSSPGLPDGFETFPLRKPLEIDYRASCHCGHGTLLDLGWVCSACLAVHCSQPRECVGCGTHFSADGVEEKNSR